MAKQRTPETTGRPLFKNKTGNPDLQESTAMRLQALQMLQEASKNINLGHEQVEIRLASNTPIYVVQIGDIHLGSRATDYSKLQEVVDAIMQHDNVAATLSGDLIEGLKKAYFATNSMQTPLTVLEMIIDITNILRPLAQSGKLLAQVSDYFGHDGWMLTEAGLNGDYVINTFLNQDVPENHQVRRLRQGGNLILSFANGSTVVWNQNHIPGANSKYDPTYGVKQKAKHYPAQQMPDLISAAHIHQAASDVTNFPDCTVAFIVNGTLKGVNSDHPDMFGQLLSLGKVGAMNQGVVLAPRRKHHANNARRVYPSHDIEHGLRTQQVMETYDNLMAQGILGEVIGLADNAAQQAPLEMKFNSRKSTRTRVKHNEKIDTKNGASASLETLNRYGYSEQYKKLFFELNNVLGAPILLQFLSNTRFGSNSSNPDEVWAGYVEPAIRDPYRLVLPGRNIIDTSVSGRHDRMTVLQATAELMQQIKDQIPFTFLDGILRQEQWKSSLGKGEELGPIAAGSTLAGLIHGENSRLAENRSEIEFQIDSPQGKRTIKGVVVDKLGNRASYDRATFGLTQMYYHRELPKDIDFAYGGHTPLSGYTVWQKKFEPGYIVFVAPGWPAHQANSKGKSNVMQGGQAGLSVVYDPVTKMLFPAGNYFQTEELYGAMKADSYIQRSTNGNPDRYLKRSDRKSKRKTR